MKTSFNKHKDLAIRIEKTVKDIHKQFNKKVESTHSLPMKDEVYQSLIKHCTKNNVKIEFMVRLFFGDDWSKVIIPKLNLNV